MLKSEKELEGISTLKRNTPNEHRRPVHTGLLCLFGEFVFA